MKIDLQALTQGFFADHTNEEIVAVCSSTLPMVERWRAGDSTIPLKMLQKLIDAWPQSEAVQWPMKSADYKIVSAEVTASPTIEAPPPPATKLCVLMATNRGIQGACLESIWRNLRMGGSEFGPKDCDLMTEGTYDNFMNRNRLAHRFLRGGAQWALWLDDDMVFPAGQLPHEAVPWFKSATGAKYADLFCAVPTINRLLWLAKTTGKKVIGAAYFDRYGNGTPMFSAGRDDAALRASLRGLGPRDAQAPTNWTGTGCLLVHRDVFLDIRQKLPDGAVKDADRKPWLQHDYGYFDPIDNSGDDVSFCDRVRASGHEIVVDLATFCAHVGNKAFLNAQ